MLNSNFRWIEGTNDPDVIYCGLLQRLRAAHQQGGIISVQRLALSFLPGHEEQECKQHFMVQDHSPRIPFLSTFALKYLLIFCAVHSVLRAASVS